MRNTTPVKLVVGSNESIPEVLARLRAATGGAATVAIPTSSSLFLTASEFRALKATVDQSRIALTVETDDRLRKQLAAMFQIPVVELLPGAVSNLEEQEPPKKAEPEPPKVESVLPDLPKLDLPPPLEVAPKWEPRPEGESGEDDVPLPGPKRRSLPVGRRTLAIGAGAVLLLAVVAVAAAYLFQSATVTVTVERQPVSAEIAYAVVSPGADAPTGGLFTLTAEPVTLEVPYRETIPVTGVLREPLQAASGRVALRNPTDSPVDIAAGTIFTAKDGTEYAFTESVTVPASDANGAGRAEAAISAVAGGEIGNREIGMLSGRLDNGVYYSNRDAAIAGGTDKKTPIVDQKDIDRLVANANEQLPKRIIDKPLEDGRIVLPGSIQPGELNFTTDHQVGDQAETVTIDAKMVVSAMAFNPADAVSRATDTLQSNLAANVPAGYELEPATIAMGTPVLVNDRGDAGLYTLTATADARAVVDEAQQKQIAEAIAGLGEAEAAERLREFPFVQSATIDTFPGILFSGLPGDAGKIEIETQ